MHIEQGTDGIVALGTTGESSTMTHEEDDEVARLVIETVNGRIPVICGAGSNCTRTQLEKSRRYHDMGADGLLLITPITTRPMRRECIATSPRWPMRWISLSALQCAGAHRLLHLRELL